MVETVKELLCLTERIRQFAELTYTRNIPERTLEHVTKDWVSDYGEKEKVNGFHMGILLDHEYKKLRSQNGANT
jgi:hypothetical protein